MNILDKSYGTRADNRIMRAVKRGLVVAFSIYAIIIVALMLYWSDEPELFDIKAAAHAPGNRQGEPVKGYVTTATLMNVADTLLDKRGGYLSNDIFPPRCFA